MELPLHIAWSGMTAYEMSKPRQRMGLYRAVPHEGLRDDLPRYLDQDLLLQMWPVLRTLVGRTVWEDASPQLASRQRTVAATTGFELAHRQRHDGAVQVAPVRWSNRCGKTGRRPRPISS